MKNNILLKYIKTDIKKFLLKCQYFLNKFIDKSPKKIYKLYKKNEFILIVSCESTFYVAKEISYYFELLGIKSKIINNIKFKFNNTNIYLLLSPVWLDNIPKYYFVYNLEQSTAKRWMNNLYFKKLNNSICVFDYSLENILFLKNKLKQKNIFYLPVLYSIKANKIIKKTIPLLFYGNIEQSRRRYLINLLKNRYKNILIIENVFNDEIEQILDITKIVINIHYYDDAMLETTRISQCLSHNCLVISEKSNYSYPKIFNKLIEMVEIGDICSLIKKIDFYLRNEEALNEKIKNNKKIMSTVPSTYRILSNYVKKYYNS